jgi:hypothetical protein
MIQVRDDDEKKVKTVMVNINKVKFYELWC